jgi:hypothetical protein
MEGWFCIYECSMNQWLMEGDYRLNDRDYHKIMVGTKHAVQTQPSSYSSNGVQMEIIDTQTSAVLVDGGIRVTPNSIMKWKTMAEAEKWLLNYSKVDGDFYSIRKIYF